MNFNDKHTSGRTSQTSSRTPNDRRASSVQLQTQPRRANVVDRSQRQSYAPQGHSATHQTTNTSSEKNKRTRTSRSDKNGDKDAASQRRKARRGQDLMRYAQDSKFVRSVYQLITGPYKMVIFVIFFVICAVSIYLPVSDLYCAMRTQQDLTVLIQTQLDENDLAQEEVDRLMSQEGIEDIAREELGLVMPGETVGVVVGVDDEGNPLTEDPQDTSGEESAVEDPDFDVSLPFGPNATEEEQQQAEGQTSGKPLNPLESDIHPVLGDIDQDLDDKERDQKTQKYAPVTWYYAIGDFIFGYHGASGETIVSTGTHSVD